ncbi:MAG: ATP-binding protein [Chloroflexi bacterium]|nr:ATP-binding protein [Chloroflexota bacterium]
MIKSRQQASSLTVFRCVLADEIGQAFLTLVDGLTSTTQDPETIARSYGHLFALLAGEAELYTGELAGDAWQNHLLDRLLADENAFSRKAEVANWEEIGPSLLQAVRSDLRLLQLLFQFDARLASQAAELCVENPAGAWPRWDAFNALGGQKAGGRLAEMKRKFARSLNWSDLAADLADHHQQTGVGLFGHYRAFRWLRRDGAGSLEGISHPDPIRLDQIIGYEPERQLLIQNTEHFLAGYPANNVLLYGDRGTGKSSTVKSLLNEYGCRGLRMVEVSKQQLDDFPQILTLLRERRERFILFVDDLSFEDDETHYKELKAVLEGGLEARPDNVLLYATSNRRHLIRERFGDRQEGLAEEIHPGDTFEEKLSLSDRFGITLTFLSPDQDRYLNIVEGLARQRRLTIPADALRQRALQWATRHNGRSGRTARQFIDFLTGELGVALSEPLLHQIQELRRLPLPAHEEEPSSQS